MDLKQLEYFIAIAEEGKITLAAQRLHIAQPPLSQQLKNLEAELGVTLFERTSRRLQITDAGHMFLERAKQIVDLSHTAKQEMDDYANGFQGTVLLGITPTAVPLVLAENMKEFHKLYQNIGFEVFEGNTDYILNLVQKGIVDIGIVRSPIQHSELYQMEKPSEPMVAAMTPELNWSEEDHCTVEELRGKNLILYRRYELLVLDTLAAHQISPHIVGKCDRSYTAVCCAEGGLGVAILPAGAIRMASKRMKFKTILSDALSTKTIAVRQPNRRLSKPATAFWEYFLHL